MNGIRIRIAAICLAVCFLSACGARAVPPQTEGTTAGQQTEGSGETETGAETEAPGETETGAETEAPEETGSAAETVAAENIVDGKFQAYKVRITLGGTDLPEVYSDLDMAQYDGYELWVNSCEKQGDGYVLRGKKRYSGVTLTDGQREELNGGKRLIIRIGDMELYEFWPVKIKIAQTIPYLDDANGYLQGILARYAEEGVDIYYCRTAQGEEGLVTCGSGYPLWWADALGRLWIMLGETELQLPADYPIYAANSFINGNFNRNTPREEWNVDLETFVRERLEPMISEAGGILLHVYPDHDPMEVAEPYQE